MENNTIIQEETISTPEIITVGEIKESSSIRSNILDFLQSIIIAISICIVIYLFIATPNQIEGESMEPNFDSNQIVLTSKVHEWLGGTSIGESLGLNYHRGDVIVFQKPGLSDFIKRVIGLPGETVAIKDGYVYINGEKLNEPYLPDTTYTEGATFIPNDGEPKTIPENHYFVMGDNRNNSRDSRYIDVGFVDRGWMKGKVLVRYWPLNQLKIIN